MQQTCSVLGFHWDEKDPLRAWMDSLGFSECTSWKQIVIYHPCVDRVPRETPGFPNDALPSMVPSNILNEKSAILPIFPPFLMVNTFTSAIFQPGTSTSSWLSSSFFSCGMSPALAMAMRGAFFGPLWGRDRAGDRVADFNFVSCSIGKYVSMQYMI